MGTECSNIMTARSWYALDIRLLPLLLLHVRVCRHRSHINLTVLARSPKRNTVLFSANDLHAGFVCCLVAFSVIFFRSSLSFCFFPSRHRQSASPYGMVAMRCYATCGSRQFVDLPSLHTVRVPRRKGDGFRVKRAPSA